MASDSPKINPNTPARPMTEALARTLRHEIGDFLQEVYACVAILQNRLPHDMVSERDVLARLRQRAGACRALLDAVQDLLCPLTLACEVVDLAGLAERLLALARSQHPDVEIVAVANARPTATIDPQRVAQVGQMLLTNACEFGARRVTLCTATDPGTGEPIWSVTDDGPGIRPELADRLFEPFFTTLAGHAGLGLPLARKLAELHGGRLTAANLPAGGFEATVRFPIGEMPVA